MKKRKIWYANTNHIATCSEMGFLRSPSGFVEGNKVANHPDNVQGGDVFVIRNPTSTNQVRVYKLVDPAPDADLIIGSDDPSEPMSVNADWVDYDINVEELVSKIQDKKCIEILKQVANSQRPFTNNECYPLPDKSEWAYIACAGKTALRRSIYRKIDDVMMETEYNLKRKLHAQLCNPATKSLVVAVTGGILFPYEISDVFTHVKDILVDHGYAQRVHVWDAQVFGFVISFFPDIVGPLIRAWINRKEQKRR